MSPEVPAEIVVPILGGCALLCSLIATHIALGWRGGARGLLLVLWIALTAVWMLANALFVASGAAWIWPGALSLDLTRSAAALILLQALLKGGGRTLPELVRDWGWPALIALVGAIALMIHGRWLAQVQLVLAVLGLTLLESYWRSLPDAARWAAKPLCLALGAVWGFDLLAHGETVLLGQPTFEMWLARAVVAALCSPLVWIHAARAPAASIAVTLSRRALLQSTALAACGGYLLLISAAGFYVRDFGGRWGPLMQMLLLAAGALLFMVLAGSASLRARARLFIARHFFKLKYDYRQRWLGLTRTLSQAQSFEDSGQRLIATLAELVESPGGVLWWADEAGDFKPCAAHQLDLPAAIEPHDSPALAQLAGGQAVVLLDALPGAAAPAVAASIPRAWLAIALQRGDMQKGLVLLQAPRVPVDVDWEVRDVLTTVAAQALTDLCHWQAIDALIAARKFEATSRLATFLVHDFKNCIAELTLLSSNARRHIEKPAFRQDMLHTLDHLVSRMHSLMDTLRQGMESPDARAVELAPILRALAQQMSQQQPAPALHLVADAVVRADSTRLARVIGHLVQNAIDATDAAGRVWINLKPEGDHALIEIHDTGSGMSETFVRDKLFKPFHTTKAQGMGIGTFEAQQYIRALGGRIDVDTAPGRGTSIRVRLPRADSLAPNRIAA